MSAEARREYQRRWRAANADKVRAARRRWEEKQTAEDKRARHERGRERAIVRATEWNRENRDRANANARRSASRPAVKQKRSEYRRAWAAANRAKVHAYSVLHNGRRRGANRPTRDARDFAVALLADPCSYCGGRATEIDHIVPISSGGTNDWDNLAAACRGCNARKKDKTLLHYLRLA